MKRIDSMALSGVEIFFLLIIVLLILLTGGMVYALLEMGPQEQPDYVIEDVYFKEKQDGFAAEIYVTNIGKNRGKGTLEWEVTQGNRLLDEGETELSIDGRTTKKSTINIDAEGNEVFTINVEAGHDADSVDSYKMQVRL